MTDQQLQQKIENGDSLTGRDAKAYQKVFNGLQKEVYQLPIGFADRVLAKLQQRPASLFKEYFWLAAGWISFLIGAGVSIFLIDFNFSWGAFRFLASYPGLLVLAVLLISIIQWLDKKLVRAHLS
jgi:hypothetical protein